MRDGQIREELLRALNSLHEELDSVEVVVEIKANFYGAAKSHTHCVVKISPDKHTTLADVGVCALDGAKHAIREMLTEIDELTNDGKDDNGKSEEA